MKIILSLFILSLCFISLYSEAYSQQLFTLSDDQVYYSLDSGKSWHGIYVDSSEPVHFRDICCCRAEKAIYSAVSFGLIKSTDNGKHWKKIYPAGYSENVNRVACSLDGASVVYALTDSSFYRSGNGGKNWKSLALPSSQIFFIAPFYNSGRIYLAGGEAFYVSSDGGSTWKRAGKGVFDGEIIVDMAANPSNPKQVYLATSGGLFYTGDGGKSWKNKSISPKDWIQTQKIIWASDNQNRLYAFDSDVKENGSAILRRSNDGGKTWGVIAAKDEIYLIACDPLKSSTIFLSSVSNLSLSGIESSLSAMSVSFDSGKNWKSLDSVMPGYSAAKKLIILPW